MSETESTHLIGMYKVEYPFQAIDATLYGIITVIAGQQNAKELRRTAVTTGSVLYTIAYEDYTVEFTLQALDTRLCWLQVRTPYDKAVTEEQLRALLDDIVRTHEMLIEEAEAAETLLSADRARGGRDTWPEDAEAIARLQAGHDRAIVKRDWLKRATNNRKRKKIADTNNRFRQLVLKANKS